MNAIYLIVLFLPSSVQFFILVMSIFWDCGLLLFYHSKAKSDHVMAGLKGVQREVFPSLIWKL